MTTRLLPLVLIGTLLPVAAQSQGAPPQGAPAPATAGPNVEVDPIRCWWRSSSGAVRIGETFSVVLTCAVLQNDAVQVVPDESRLDSSVAQLAPWELVGGSHPADLYSANRRFFQYEYLLRIISPDAIGKDIKVPDPIIHYRVNSSVSANSALQGRDNTYLLSPLTVKVLSLVPPDAPDIRDSARESFATVEQLAFRANVLRIVAITAIALGGLVAFLGIARLLVRGKKTKTVGFRGLSESAMLGLASRELAAVQRDADGGWTGELVGRALAAARIAASIALGRPVSQHEGAAAETGDGRLVAAGWLRRKPLIVSGAATPENLSRAIERLSAAAEPARRTLLEDLHGALSAFTAVQYARETAFDRSALDEATGRAVAATRRLKTERMWPMSYFRRWNPRVQAHQQA